MGILLLLLLFAILMMMMVMEPHYHLVVVVHSFRILCYKSQFVFQWLAVKENEKRSDCWRTGNIKLVTTHLAQVCVLLYIQAKTGLPIQSTCPKRWFCLVVSLFSPSLYSTDSIGTPCGSDRLIWNRGRGRQACSSYFQNAPFTFIWHLFGFYSALFHYFSFQINSGQVGLGNCREGKYW